MFLKTKRNVSSLNNFKKVYEVYKDHRDSIWEKIGEGIDERSKEFVVLIDNKRKLHFIEKDYFEGFALIIGRSSSVKRFTRID